MVIKLEERWIKNLNDLVEDDFHLKTTTSEIVHAIKKC